MESRGTLHEQNSTTSASEAFFRHWGKDVGQCRDENCSLPSSCSKARLCRSMELCYLKFGALLLESDFGYFDVCCIQKLCMGCALTSHSDTDIEPKPQAVVGHLSNPYRSYDLLRTLSSQTCQTKIKSSAILQICIYVNAYVHTCTYLYIHTCTYYIRQRWMNPRASKATRWRRSCRDIFLKTCQL